MTQPMLGYTQGGPYGGSQTLGNSSAPMSMQRPTPVNLGAQPAPPSNVGGNAGPTGAAVPSSPPLSQAGYTGVPAGTPSNTPAAPSPRGSAAANATSAQNAAGGNGAGWNANGQASDNSWWNNNAGAYGTPTYGAYGSTVSTPANTQGAAQTWSITNDANYADYQRMGAQAQGFGGQAGQQLNSQGVVQALGAQSAQAQGPSSAQTMAQANQNAASGLLLRGAQGNGPSAAQGQYQQNLDAAIRAQQAQANSARGNQLAQAGLNAQQQSAAMQGQAAAQSAQLRAQEQQAAQANYAQSSAAQGQNANQAYTAQANALNFAAQNQAANQATNENYYLGQQQAYQEQQQMAANLATSQINADYGLAGTQLQTQTQQNIANQQSQQAMIGAFGAAIGTAISDRRAKKNVTSGAKAIDALLGSIKPAKYAYKNPDAAGAGHGIFVSPMAQDLEQSEAGRSLVRTGPDGTKVVDYGHGLGLMLGAMGRLHQRIESLGAKR